MVEEAPVAGRPWLEVSNVSRPTMTVYPPKGKSTGVAVVVFPGGGYKVLAIDGADAGPSYYPAFR